MQMPFPFSEEDLNEDLLEGEASPTSTDAIPTGPVWGDAPPRREPSVEGAIPTGPVWGDAPSQEGPSVEPSGTGGRGVTVGPLRGRPAIPTGIGRPEQKPLNLADPRFVDLYQAYQRRNEIIEAMAGEQAEDRVPFGFTEEGAMPEAYQATMGALSRDYDELDALIKTLSDELQSEYGLSSAELKGLIIPTNLDRVMEQYPWYETANADPIVERGRRAYLLGNKYEQDALSVPFEGFESDERMALYDLALSAYEEYDAMIDAVMEKYSISKKEATRLMRINPDGDPGLQITEFVDPGGLEGLVSGFVEGLTTYGSEYRRTDRFEVSLGRGGGTIMDSFIGGIEFIMGPWQVWLNTISSFRYLRDFYTESGGLPTLSEERAELLGTTFETALPQLRLVSALRQTSTAQLLSDIFTNFSLIGEAQQYNFYRFPEEDGGNLGMVNLYTGRTANWIDFSPNIRIKAAGINIGPGGAVEAIVWGTDYAEQIGLFERFGITNPFAKEAIGFLIDFVTDPLLIADGAFVAARIAAAGGNKAAATELRRTAESIRRAVTPRGVVDSNWRRLNDPYDAMYYQSGRTPEQTQVMANGARPVVERSLISFGKLIDNFMNTPIPVDGNRLRSALGIVDSEVKEIPLRYFLFTEGVIDLPIPFIRDGITNLPPEFTGSPVVGPSLRDRSMGKAQAFNRIALEAAENVNSILAQPVARYDNVQLGDVKVNFVGKGLMLDRNGEAYVRTMNELVFDMIDNVGVVDRDRFFRDWGDVPEAVARANAVGQYDASGLPARYSVEVASGPLMNADPTVVADYFDRVRNIARAFGVDEAEALSGFRTAVTRASQAAAELGWLLSDYDTWISVANQAADNLTARTGRVFDPAFMRMNMEAKLAGFDVPLYRETGQVQPLAFVDEITYTGPRPPGAPTADDVPNFVISLNPEQIIMDTAYLRRLEEAIPQISAMPESPEKSAMLDLVQRQLADYGETESYLRASGWRQLEDGSGRVTWEKIPGMSAPEAPAPPWFSFDMDDYELFTREMRAIFYSTGNPFAHLAPETYLQGLNEGYLRRIFGAKMDADTMSLRVRQRDLALYPSSMSLDGLVGRVRTAFGDDAAEAVSVYLSGRTDNNIIFTEDIFTVISRATGKEIGIEQNKNALVNAFNNAYGENAAAAADAYFSGRGSKAVESLGYKVEDIERMFAELSARGETSVGRWRLVNDVIYGDDFDYNFIKETNQILDAQQRGRPTVPGGAGYDPTMTPGTFSARLPLTPDERAQLLQIKSASGSLASLGGKGARAIRSQSLLNDLYTFLRENQLLYSKDDLLNAEVASRFDYSLLNSQWEQAGITDWRRIFDNENRRFVQIPDNQAAWGVLAGSVVPEDIGRWMMIASQAPVENRNWFFGEGLNFYRRLLLSPYPTVARNLYGQFVIAQQSGIDLIDMVANLPRAAAARREYLATGQSPIMGGGEKLVAIFQDVTQSAEIRKMQDNLLEALTRPDVLQMLRKEPDATRQLAIFGRLIADSLDQMAHVGATSIGKGIQLESSNPLLNALSQGFNKTVGNIPIPTFGALDAFQATEEITRISIFLSVRDRLLEAGVPMQQAIARGAFQGNTAVNNYANVPLVVSMLRSSGLGMFPAFSYFQLSRIGRAAWENPQAIARQQHFIQGTSNIFSADLTDEDRRLLYSRMPAHTRGVPGIYVSSAFFGGDGQTVVRIPVEKIFPIGFSDFAALGEQAFVGGAYNPILDGAIALLLNNGMAPMAAQYGRGRVFYENDEPMTKLFKTFQWLAGSYVPGPLREIGRAVQTVQAQVGPLYDPVSREFIGFTEEARELAEYRREVSEERGTYQNREPYQFIIRQLGLNTYIIDIASRDSVSAIGVERGLEAQVNAIKQSARTELQDVLKDYPEGSPQFQTRQAEIEDKAFRALYNLAREQRLPDDEVRRLFGQEILDSIRRGR